MEEALEDATDLATGRKAAHWPVSQATSGWPYRPSSPACVSYLGPEMILAGTVSSFHFMAAVFVSLFCLWLCFLPVFPHTSSGCSVAGRHGQLVPSAFQLPFTSWFRSAAVLCMRKSGMGTRLGSCMHVVVKMTTITHAH